MALEYYSIQMTLPLPYRYTNHTCPYGQMGFVLPHVQPAAEGWFRVHRPPEMCRVVCGVLVVRQQ